MDGLSMLVRAAKQLQQKQDGVVLIRFDPEMTDTEKVRFKAFLRRAHRARIPVYMYHPTLTWSKCYKCIELLTPDERLHLVKGYFLDDHLPEIKERIKSIEKVPKKRIYDIEPGAGFVQRAQQALQLIQ